MSRKNNRGLVVIEGGGSAGGLLWLLVGGVVGAGLGLLLAPHSGKKTRALIGERLASLKEKAEDAFDELSEEGEALLEADEEEEEEQEAEEEAEEEAAAAVEASRPGEDGEETSEDEAPERRVPSARAELERRLARARARRHRELAEEDEEPVA
jgi:gas vesicle protein